jgi:polysaccharide pyruvyl transferase WcaK-like protein
METPDATKRPLLILCDALINLGDLALLGQSIMVGRADGRQVHVRQWAPTPPLIARQVQAMGATIISGRRMGAMLRLARGCDAVIGGGQIIRDNVTPASLLAMAMTLMAVRLGGGRVSTWGLGVSVVRRAPLRLLWCIIMGLCDRIRVRDTLSQANAQALFGAGKIDLTADMAFLPGALHDGLAFSGERSTILIAPCIEGSEQRSIDGARFPTLLACLKERLPHAGIVIACHDPRADLDAGAADLLMARYAMAGAVKLADGQLASLSRAYAQAGVVVTNRLHASIFALLSGAPLLVVDDGSDKMAALCAAFAIPAIRMTDEGADCAGAVAAAFGFDRAARASALARMAGLAGGNLAALG